MEQSDDVSCRELVKDGAWCVPEAERPQNWRSLSVRERRVETTVDTTRETVLIESNETQSAEPERTSSLEELSFVPVEGEDFKACALLAVRYWSGAGMSDEQAEEYSDAMTWHGEQARRHIWAKTKTDEVLRAWVKRNLPQLRHVGVRSRAIKDLWFAIHLLVSSCGAVPSSLEPEEEKLLSISAIKLPGEDDLEYERRQAG